MAESDDYGRALEAAAAAERDGDFKRAYQLYGLAMALGTGDRHHCRYRRALCALTVASTRLDRVAQLLADDPADEGLPRLVMKAGCWVSRSEAYLQSATEDADDSELSDLRVRMVQAQRERERFRGYTGRIGLERVAAAASVRQSDPSGASGRAPTGRDSANPDRRSVMAEANESPSAFNSEDLVSVIRQDHEEIKSLIASVEIPSDTAAQRDAFQQLVRKLAVHETAEEEVVRPAVRQAGGDAVADARNREESGAKETLSDLERLGVDAPEFGARFQTLKAEVLAHAQQEEQEEHPLLADLGQERLSQLATAFRAAEAVAPTHPHPHGPESAVGNVAVGPAVAIIDRARDAVRRALQKIGS